MAVPAVGSSRAVETEQLHEQTEGHLDEEEAPPAPPVATQPRPFSARSFATRRGRAPHTARRPERRTGEHFQDQDPGGGHAQGVPDFPDPLPGFHHYGEHELVLPHRPLDVGPADPYYYGGMAHGVATEEIHHGGRPTAKPEDRAAYAATRQLVEEEVAPKVDPVPVYIVERGAGARPLKRAALRQVPVPAAGADPIVLVPRNPHRSSVRLLNESGSPVRLTFDLTETGGALLPAAMTSYLEIDTEDEICAYLPAAASGSSPDSTVVYGNLTVTSAGQQIVATPALPPGQYSVVASIDLGGTPTASDANNVQLQVGATVVGTLLNSSSSGVIVPNPPIIVTVPAGGAVISADSITGGSGTAAYRVQLAVTPAQTDEGGGTGPALVSVIEQYDVAGGT